MNNTVCIYISSKSFSHLVKKDWLDVMGTLSKQPQSFNLLIKAQSVFFFFLTSYIIEVLMKNQHFVSFITDLNSKYRLV